MIEAMPGCIAIALRTRPSGSFDISYLYSPDNQHDIIISKSPCVMTDLYTLNQLKENSIDFEYETGEFVITKDKNVVSAFA